MKLINRLTGQEVKVGDTVYDVRDGDEYTVDFFREPHKACSEGKISVKQTGAEEYFSSMEYYVSVFGLEWIEREDRGTYNEYEPY